MISARALLLLPLAALGLIFAALWLRELRRVQALRTGPIECAIGFITDFLDTLGIGSFATTTAFFRMRGLVADRLLPGTLNVGHALPTILQALIYIAIIDVDMITLVAMIGASVIGAHLGAARVIRWPENRVRVVMGLSLSAAALLLLLRLLRLLPPGSDAISLPYAKLAIGVAGNFVLGALMTMGVGLYGPCLILVSLLGMNPTAAFPIMMGSCAFLMPVASVRFMHADQHSPRAALGLTLGGAPGVLIAAFLVRELSLDAVRWIVVFVALYTATTLLRAARGSARNTLRIDER